MTAILCYGIELTDDELIQCCRDETKLSSNITVKDWCSICETFNIIQKKFNIDSNMIKSLLREYAQDNDMQLVIVDDNYVDQIFIDPYNYSEYMDYEYDLNLGFCEQFKVDFEHSGDSSRCNVLYVTLGRVDYKYNGKIGFDLEELASNEIIKNFNLNLEKHPKLSKFKPRIFVLGSTAEI